MRTKSKAVITLLVLGLIAILVSAVIPAAAPSAKCAPGDEYLGKDEETGTGWCKFNCPPGEMGCPALAAYPAEQTQGLDWRFWLWGAGVLSIISGAVLGVMPTRKERQISIFK